MADGPGVGVAPAFPTAPVRWPWITAFVLAIVGVACGWFGPLQILLPAQSQLIAGPGGKEALLALVTGVGAAVSMIGNPLWGLISDRIQPRFGRRRLIIVLGTAVGVVGLLVLAIAADPVTMVLGWAIVQLGLNGPFAALAALIADVVPPAQRGLVGAWFGIAQTIGVVAGTAIAVALGEGALGYVALAIAVPALSIALLIATRERADRAVEDAPAPIRWRDITHLGSQFRWAWLIRFLLNLTNALVLLYLYFYLHDAIGIAEPGELVLIVTVVCAVGAAVVAGVGGVLSDRWRRRRVFVVAGAIAMAAGSVVMAVVHTMPALIVAAVLVGIGWGLYVAVDLAILTAVLPSESSRATVLGIGNIASALPQVLAPAIAAPIVLALGGYLTLYLLAAALAVLAAVCVTRLTAVP